MHYLTLEEILRLHFQLIEDFGGRHGVRDENRLKSVVEAPRQEIFGQAQYPTLAKKAAVYVRNIIGDHPFSDGNKRIGCFIFLLYARRQNICIKLNDNCLVALALLIAESNPSQKELMVRLVVNLLVD